MCSWLRPANITSQPYKRCRTQQVVGVLTYLKTGLRTRKKATGLRDKSNQDTRSSCCVKHNARRSPALLPSRRFAARFSPAARSKVPSSYTSACMHLLHHWLALRRHFKATNPISAASASEAANRKHHHTVKCAASVIPGRQHASGSVTSPSLACFRQTQPRSSRHE